MKNKYGQTKEEALIDGTFDRLDFILGGYVGRTGLFGPMNNRICRFCDCKKGKTKGVVCGRRGKHTWIY